MSIDRVKFQNIVASQIPDFIRDDFPLLVEFLEQYYASQEFQSGTYDIIQNIDKYVNVDELFAIKNSTVLGTDISYSDTTITTSPVDNFTYGFPDRDGLLQIDDEIIYYEYKTDTTFEGCVRGFSAVTSYEGSNTPDELVFESSEIDEHTSGTVIYNLNVLFLQEFFNKLKIQVIPGFSERTLYDELDQRNFIYNANSFYTSKGTEQSFEILFRTLYGEDVKVIRPSEYLIRPSNANYKVTRDFVVESIQGDPLDLKNRTLYQKSTGARGSVSNVSPIDYDNDQYYQISIDYGYDRDLDVKGTVFSNFEPNKYTKILNTVSFGSTVIDVDSTIGFAESGSLLTRDTDDNNITLFYDGKNDNQFFNVSGVISTIDAETVIRENEYSYAYIGEGTDNQIRVRITSTLKELILNEPTYYYKKDDIIKVKTIGSDYQSEKTKNWNLNIKTYWNIESIEEEDISENKYKIITYEKVFLKPGYSVSIKNTNTGNVFSAIVSSENDSKTFTIKSFSTIPNLNDEYVIENQILKTNSTKYPYLNKYIANVQNTYSNSNGEVLVSSNSLARYNNVETNPYNKTITFSGTVSGETLTLTKSVDHGFYTGDAIYYFPGIEEVTTITPDGNIIITEVESKIKGLSEGVYYARRLNQNSIKLSRSRSDIFSNSYITLGGSVTNNKFSHIDFYNKTIEPQELYRSIAEPENKSGKYTTESGYIYNGILINGVEILNYKSSDKVLYGDIQDFSIFNSGKNYDVINPPKLVITDSVGTGASGYVAVSGKLERIDILDTGFDYQIKPIVKINGGNGKDAAADVRITAVEHSVSFYAESSSDYVDLTNNTISFTTYHKFRDNEKVVYDTNSSTAVGGLSTNSFYYVGVLDSNTIQLYRTESDSVSGINTINLTSYGSGVHEFKSSTTKNIVTSVVVTNPGSGYQNKERAISGINTALNQFTIKNHGYSSKEIVHYSTTGSPVNGLSTSKDYFVVKLDDNTFSLSEVGTGNTSIDYYYNNNILVNIESSGSGTFNYQPIVVSVEGVTGVSTRAGQDFSCKVVPVFRGSLDSIGISSGGVGYGSSEIINFNRQPVISVFSGNGAQLTPVINNGQIVDVLVSSPGSGYNSPPDIKIVSETGKNASITPVIVDGKITDVKVIKGGEGYTPNKTSLNVISSGSESVIECKIKEWIVNLFEKNFNNILNDDGFVGVSISEESLQYSNLYVPRILRESTYAISGTDEDNTLYGTPDLIKDGPLEVDSQYHSPIVGWAYDGNPIYGPYGFDSINGSGNIRRMRSSYKLNLTESNRPPSSLYPSGFFVEDYIYTGAGDLDIHNGRFCVTPDYPEGVYAYFATINSINDSAGPFQNYRRPVFPYIIGDSFNSSPNPFNYKSISNQKFYDIESNNWSRNTKLYNINSGNSGYSYIFNSNQVKEQTINVTSTSLGNIENIDVLSGGSNYKVNDKVVFDNISTGIVDSNADARVERINGKVIDTISIATTSIYDVEFIPSSSSSANSFIGFAPNPHNFKNNDLVTITGLSDYFAGFDGNYEVGIRTDNFILNLGINSVANTGIETYFYVSGLLNFPYIRENDILTIDQERVKVISIDSRSSRIRVLREQDGTVGVSHEKSTPLFEDPRKFTINTKSLKTPKTFNYNKELYFEPAESVGVGTALGTGIGVTITFSNPGVGVTQVFVEPQSIYYPNHALKLNDKITYNTNGGSSIQVWDGVNPYKLLSSYTDLYAVPLTKDTFAIGGNKIGLGTTGYYVGINTNTAILYFTDIGSGSNHSFKTDLNNVISAEIDKNVVTVSTSSKHNLSSGDEVFVSVKPKETITVTVKYDDYNGRIVFDPRTFTAGDVNIAQNSITFSDEYFELGDKVIHTSTAPSGGLINEGIYYVVPFNGTNIRLVKNKSDVNSQNPDFVDITSASDGTISKINPGLNLTRNSILKFDLSDISLSYVYSSVRYSAFDMNLYSDREYSNIFFTSKKTGKFEVTKSGQPGIDATANLTLVASDFIPDNLYYKFDIDNVIFNPTVKTKISEDKDVNGYSQISIVKSSCEGRFNISGIGSTTFEYGIYKKPETLVYNSSNSTLSYTTNSKSAFGSIHKIDVTNKGSGYRELPEITSVVSSTGSGAILNANSTNIGSILSNRINNIGFDYPTDKTLRLTANPPELLRIDSLSSFERIDITSSGRNYLFAPTLVVIDSATNEVITDIDLFYKLGDNEVTIVKNTFGISNTSPIIIPTQNSNGIGIASVTYNTSSKVVRAYLNTQFSNSSDFRFNVGSRVLVENLSVGVGSVGRGYNSQNYNYELFEITNSDSQLGGTGAWFEYSLKNLLEENEFPGIIDNGNSSGRAIPEVDFPVFESVLKKNNFFIGEEIVSDRSKGVVERWNPNNGYLVISTSDDLTVGSKVIGQSSNTQGLIASKIDFDAEISTGVGATFYSDWQTNSGFLNDDLQRMPNNEYYQNLSYSLKSRVSYDTWNDAVSALNHTSGFIKFSDYVAESIEDEPKGIVKFNESSIDLIVDIIGEANLNCTYDFDYVAERAIDVDGKIISKEITFENRVITDYFESVGNRVLSIDDISETFNSNSRATIYAPIATYDNNYAYNKIFVYVRDKIYTNRRQFSIVSILRNNIDGYIQEYAKLDTDEDLGSFDYSAANSEWNLLFYPIDFTYNSYDTSTISFNILNDVVSTGTTSLGNVVNIFSVEDLIPPSTTTTIATIPNTYRSSKLLVQLEDTNNDYSVSEINLIHDGTDVYVLKYGDMETSAGFGTFNAYLSGGNVNVDFIPSVGVAITSNVSVIAISNNTLGATGSKNLDVSVLTSTFTAIPSSASPVANTIASFSDPIQTNYYIVSVEDLTNNEYEMFEVAVIESATSSSSFVEFANTRTGGSLGQVGVDTSGGSVQLTYTPLPNTQTEVRTFGIGIDVYGERGLLLRNAIGEDASQIVLNNLIINTDNSVYTGSFLDVKTSFPLNHNGLGIFQRSFDGSSSDVVDLDTNSITVADHFFVTGEEVVYTYPGADSANAIGISTTNISGIGLTDKLPSNVYLVKVDTKTLRFAATAEDALKRDPVVLDITSTGVGSGHSITSTNQNSKVLIAIDNMIQSPVVSTGVTSVLNENIVFATEFNLTGVSSIFANDIIQIDDELMTVVGVGGASITSISVLRAQLGTQLVPHNTGSIVTKLTGSYNIVENTLHFTSAPKGNIPIGISSGNPDERDWVGITSSSNFQGRSFMRSGYVNTVDETYKTNYIYDDISSEFTGIRSEFTLTSNKSNVVGIATQNPIVLVNGIFQQPYGESTQVGDYILSENTGVTSITFTGNNSIPTGWDPNNSAYPAGGLIISVGSTEGFGYQPLVAAGGTAIVSAAGTIQSISIGNSGSGYRSGIQTYVNVGVQTYSFGIPNIELIGNAVISDGYISSINITNPGSGYTSSNPPEVVIDAPLRYNNIPLQYSSSSVVGSGQSATVDIIVGQGSSVITFDFRNYGFGYGNGEILTIPVGGTTGIPTNTNLSFKEFQLSVDKVFIDSFNAWSIGEIEVLDILDDQFDGQNTSFRLSISNVTFSARAKEGSLLDIESTLIVFINDILQEPGKAFSFKGGSIIKFSEPPKKGDTSKILFYKGTAGVDVSFVDILETVKIGDTLDIDNNPEFDQGIRYDQDPRIIVGINTIDTVETNAYVGPGITTDTNILRPVTWCRQTSDKIINGQPVGKDRVQYEPYIYPVAYLIQNVSFGSSFAYVDSLRPLFNSINESTSTSFQNAIKIVSQEKIVGASATAIVDANGTISSIDITNPGLGYTLPPQVSISTPFGEEVSQRATAVASVRYGSIEDIDVTSIGFGYTSSNPPSVLIQQPDIEKEIIQVSSYVGDYGVLVGFGRSTIGTETQLIADLYIPEDSFLRDSGYVGSAVTVSGISTGDYFTLFNTNVAIAASEVIESRRIDGSEIGVTSSFADSVYQVQHTYVYELNISGVGVTAVRRVFCNVTGINTTSFDNTYITFDSTGYTFDNEDYVVFPGDITYASNIGEFSWGRINFESRAGIETFQFHGNDGYAGISTSALVTRVNPLKYNNYIT